MDLHFYYCGAQDCTGGHSYGPAMRDHYLIHFIRKGKGTFRAGDTTYELGAGQGFLIHPDRVTFYQADHADPWSYAWVGFNGLQAQTYLKRANLTPDDPVFSCENGEDLITCIDDMIGAAKFTKSREVRLLGLLYLFLSQLIEDTGGTSAHHADENANLREFYVKKSVEYIHMNYARKMTITELASYIGLNRSYLCSLFKDSLGVSPQEYLIRYRIDSACTLLKNRTLSIGDVARSVGYEDPLMFSRIFSKIKSESPREYRKRVERV